MNTQVVLDEYNRLDDVLPAHLEDVVDRKLIREAYIYTVAGGCFALGLRYAGTADATAKETCLRHLRYYKQMSKREQCHVCICTADYAACTS
eukprot:9478-Heterococcus_DN1.PRE.1